MPNKTTSILVVCLELQADAKIDSGGNGGERDDDAKLKPKPQRMSQDEESVDQICSYDVDDYYKKSCNQVVLKCCKTGIRKMHLKFGV